MKSGQLCVYVFMSMLTIRSVKHEVYLMYGKKSAARYRLESCAESAEYEENPPEPQKVSNISYRYGDDRLDNGKLR